MDPDVTWEIVKNFNTKLNDRAEAAISLLGWLAGGGFTPKETTRQFVIETCQVVLVAVLDEVGE